MEVVTCAMVRYSYEGELPEGAKRPLRKRWGRV
jgi:hypothetical protein